MYGIIGIFGAARYGHETQGDCLVNTWLGGKADGVLDAAMAVYLAISIPPMQVNSRICCTRLRPSQVGDAKCSCLLAWLHEACPGVFSGQTSAPAAFLTCRIGALQSAFGSGWMACLCLLPRPQQY